MSVSASRWRLASALVLVWRSALGLPSAWVMSMLCSIDRSRLSDVEAVAFLQVHQRLTAWLAAIGLDAVLPAASAEPLVEEFTAGEGARGAARTRRSRRPPSHRRRADALQKHARPDV